MYSLVWTYQVRADCIDPFVAAYSSDGVWANFFSRSKGYQSTQLLRSGAAADCFMTIDRWDSEAAFRGFIEKHRDEYDLLDKRFDRLTHREERVGAFVDDVDLSKLVDEWLEGTRHPS